MVSTALEAEAVSGQQLQSSTARAPKLRVFLWRRNMGNTDFILSRQGGGGQSILPCPACLSSGQGPGGRCYTGTFVAWSVLSGIINNQGVSLPRSTSPLETLGVISRSWESLPAIISFLVNISNAMFCSSLMRLRTVYLLFISAQTNFSFFSLSLTLKTHTGD